MASNSFSFPPPPPPPPKLNPSHSGPPQWNAGPPHHGQGGRGGYSRGRGASNKSSRGGAGNTRGGSHGNNHGPFSNAPSPSVAGRGRGDFNRGTNHGGQKRRHDQAFQRANRQPHISSAPPPVPSFDFQFQPTPKAPVPLNSEPPNKNKQAKKNLLGLTPSFDDKEQWDEDEEAKLAAQISAGNSLQFTYRGRTASLTTKEELAAWIAERKKRYPTKARAKEAAERAKVEAAEREKRKADAAEQRRIKTDANLNKAGHKDGKNRRGHKNAPNAENETTRLHKELAEARKQIAELKKHAQRTMPITDPKDLTSELDDDEKEIKRLMMSSSDINTDDDLQDIPSEDETSSDGSSDNSETSEASDEDAPPIEESSKRQSTEKVPLPDRKRIRPPSKARKTTDGTTKKLSLYQRLTELQRENEAELVLQHILYLGDKKKEFFD